MNISNDSFKIGWGTWQGCPLLPLLFSLAIEPLAAMLRAVKGCWINTLEEKNSLYADDILLYLADADGPLTNALGIILRFGACFGFKVNWSRSIVFPFDPLFAPTMPPDVPLRVVSRFQYLRVEIQLPPSTYSSNNLFPLMA